MHGFQNRQQSFNSPRLKAAPVHTMTINATAAERQEIKQGFFEKGGFPGVIGCIDGTHIRIQGPSAHESDFVNRKGFHAINDQAPFDHKGKDLGLLNC